MLQYSFLLVCHPPWTLHESFIFGNPKFLYRQTQGHLLLRTTDPSVPSLMFSLISAMASASSAAGICSMHRLSSLIWTDRGSVKFSDAGTPSRPRCTLSGGHESWITCSGPPIPDIPLLLLPGPCGMGVPFLGLFWDSSVPWLSSFCGLRWKQKARRHRRTLHNEYLEHPRIIHIAWFSRI